MNPKLIISAGMPRAGSGWHYNLVHDLVVADGGQDARLIRQQFRLQPFLTEINCNISTLRPFRLIPVIIPTFLGNKYVIKTHAGPTKFARWLLNKLWVKSIYIYRDPRAAMLSAFEYGQKGLENDRPNAFSHLENLDVAARFIDFYIDIWKAWSKVDGVMIVRYEDFVEDYRAESDRLFEYLDLEIEQGIANRVLDRYYPGQVDQNRIGTHFSHGEPERFRNVLTPHQLEAYTKMFMPDLQHMGYKE